MRDVLVRRRLFGRFPSLFGRGSQAHFQKCAFFPPLDTCPPMRRTSRALYLKQYQPTQRATEPLVRSLQQTYRREMERDRASARYADGGDSEDNIRQIDEEDASTRLPVELWVQILSGGGPGVAGRARGVSRTLDVYGRQALADIGSAVQRGECQTPLACTRALVCAIVRDDPDDLARVLLSKSIDPSLPAIPVDGSATSALDQVLVAPLSCTATYGLRRYFFQDDPRMPNGGWTPPGGWTPVNMAVAFNSPRSIAVLAAFGARPPTSTEALLAYLIETPPRLKNFALVSIGANGSQAPLPFRNVTRADMVRRVTSAFGRRAALAAVDTNPLTITRERALADAPIVRLPDEDVGRVLNALQTGAPIAEAIAGVLLQRTGKVVSLPTGATGSAQLHAFAGNLVADMDHEWLNVIDALLEAGYSPDERMCVFPRRGRSQRVPCAASERGAAAAAFDELNKAAAQKLAGLGDAIAHGRAGYAVKLAIDAINGLVNVAVVGAILDAYKSTPH